MRKRRRAAFAELAALHFALCLCVSPACCLNIYLDRMQERDWTVLQGPSEYYLVTGGNTLYVPVSLTGYRAPVESTVLNDGRKGNLSLVECWLECYNRADCGAISIDFYQIETAPPQPSVSPWGPRPGYSLMNGSYTTGNFTMNPATEHPVYGECHLVGWRWPKSTMQASQNSSNFPSFWRKCIWPEFLDDPTQICCGEIFPHVRAYNRDGRSMGRVANWFLTPEVGYFSVNNESWVHGPEVVNAWNQYEDKIQLVTGRTFHMSLTAGFQELACIRTLNQSPTPLVGVVHIVGFYDVVSLVKFDRNVSHSPPALPLPDVLTVRMQQVQSLVHSLKPTQVMAPHMNKPGWQANLDDMLWRYEVDFKRNEMWAALPIGTDYFLIYYNKTTFDRLKLDHPPPVGFNWSVPYGLSWTWEIFADYARNISALGEGYGTSLMTAWEADIESISAMMRPEGARFTRPQEGDQEKCDLNTTEFMNVVKLIQRMWLVDQSADPIMCYRHSPNFQEWFNVWPENNLTIPPCLYGAPPPIKDEIRLLGMELMSPRMAADYGISEHPEIAKAYVPGMRTWLGGHGLGVHKSTQHEETSWLLAELLLSEGFSLATSLHMNMLPAYQRQWSRWPWLSAIVDKDMIRSAMPVYAPNTAWTQYMRWEDQKPIRTLLHDLITMQANADWAIKRACGTINNLMKLACRSHDYNYTNNSPTCDMSTNTMTITFEWKDPEPCANTPIRDPIEFRCPYTGYSSPEGILCLTLISVFSAVAILLLVLTILRGKKLGIRRRGLVCGFLLGAIIHASAGVMALDLPTEIKCRGLVILMDIGAVMMSGAISVLLYEQYVVEVTEAYGRRAHLPHVYVQYCVIVVIPAIVCISGAVFSQNVVGEVAYDFSINVAPRDKEMVDHLSFSGCHVFQPAFAIVASFNFLMIFLCLTMVITMRRLGTVTERCTRRLQALACYAHLMQGLLANLLWATDPVPYTKTIVVATSVTFHLFAICSYPGVILLPFASIICCWKPEDGDEASFPPEGTSDSRTTSVHVQLLEQERQSLLQQIKEANEEKERLEAHVKSVSSATR